jgi:hypothetical protein
MACEREEREKVEFMGEENIKEDVWTSGRKRNMENED